MTLSGSHRLIVIRPAPRTGQTGPPSPLKCPGAETMCEWKPRRPEGSQKKARDRYQPEAQASTRTMGWLFAILPLIGVLAGRIGNLSAPGPAHCRSRYHRGFPRSCRSHLPCVADS